MQSGSRRALQIFGVFLLLALAVVFYLSRRVTASASALQGEEVYASHDCTDCHLSASILRQKREKKELGLIRVRTDSNELKQFLETDYRHQSYGMISTDDRKNLAEYLRTLTP